MKTIDAAAVSGLAELLALAKDEMILLTTSEGREFILTEVGDDDDFGAEVEALSLNRELTAFLDLEERSRETRRVSLSEAKKRLGLG